ncbi:MAG: adenylosuccinate synthase [Verrucomicrobiota bacterium]|nr:adenylosuccinate synthase [Verrucomicrobiota bacterium]
MPANVLVGLQWGDEGKGKIIDVLTEKTDIVVRFQGGGNAGHTVEIEDEKYVLHLLPSGILREKTINVVGNGLVVDLIAMNEEIKGLEKRGIDVANRLMISNRAHLSFSYHKELDGLSEKRLGDNSIGTTKKGIGPTYSDKVNRCAIRVCDLLDEEAFWKKFKTKLDASNKILVAANLNVLDYEEEKKKITPALNRIKPFIADTVAFLNKAVKDGKSILFEGAQGMWLDVDFGTYPYVTSSNTTVGGACTGTGVPPQAIDSVVGIAKAYTTRVGEGPFMTELLDESGATLRKIGHEFGATTGRPRRCGWFDAVATKYSAILNGVDKLCIMKLDVLSNLSPLKICTAYKLDGKLIDEMPLNPVDLEKVEPVYEDMPGWTEDLTEVTTYKELPENAKKYIARLEELLEIEATIISVGPRRKQTFYKK